MSVEVKTTSTTFATGTPQALFDVPGPLTWLPMASGFWSTFGSEKSLSAPITVGILTGQQE